MKTAIDIINELENYYAGPVQMEIFGTSSAQVLNALVEAELAKYCDLTLTIDELEDRAIDAANKFFGWDPDPDHLIECICYKKQLDFMYDLKSINRSLNVYFRV